MGRQRILIGGLLLGAVALLAVLLLAPRFASERVLSGYVEGEPLYMAVPASGQLVRLEVQRGDQVTAGQTLFAVDPTQTDAQRRQAEAELAAARAMARDAREGQRPAELGVIEAELAAAEARAREAQAEYTRIAPLVERGIYAEARLDDARAARDSARAQVRAVRQRLEAATLGAREQQIAAADERVRQAEAALAGARARLAELSPPAPTDARVEEVFYQAGEWVNANQPVLSLLPADRVRLRFFVPEAQVAAYRVGREVGFACSGCPAGLRARIVYVSPRPEFTPPVIYSREARDRLVFLVEALPLQRGTLVPGQPADVTPLEPAGG